jgi:ferredoxin-thioredoxin reductase catalytic subunit
MSDLPTAEQVDALYERTKREAEAGGYQLNPDAEFARDLAQGLLVNQARYGYSSCPCRMAAGNKEEDLDIICPCDYRDPDLTQYGACYCALYVAGAIARGEKPAQAIPDRRPPPGQRKSLKPAPAAGSFRTLPYPVWRCRVCGYLCARDAPPELCPVCKAKKDRFERFI